MNYEDKSQSPSYSDYVARIPWFPLDTNSFPIKRKNWELIRNEPIDLAISQFDCLAGVNDLSDLEMIIVRES